MKSGIEFIAVDMPAANKFTIQILAAVAEHEREMISQRTKSALQAAKARWAPRASIAQQQRKGVNWESRHVKPKQMSSLPK